MIRKQGERRGTGNLFIEFLCFSIILWVSSPFVSSAHHRWRSVLRPPAVRFLDSVRCGASVDRRPHYRVTPTTTNRHPQIQKEQINTHNHTLLAHIHVFISPWNKISTTNCFPSSPIYFPPNFLLQFYILTECTFYINRGSKIY